MAIDKTVGGYVEKLKGWQAEVARSLRALAMEAAPGATEAIKWGQPVFELNGGPFAYLRAHSRHVTLGFWRGLDLPDPAGLLESSGAMMAHVKIGGPDQVPVDALKALVRAAAKLNLRDGSPTQRRAPAKKPKKPKKRAAPAGKRAAAAAGKRKRS